MSKLSLTGELILVKSVISVTFLAWWISPALAAPLAIVGNFVWLWLTPVLEDMRHGKINRDIAELKREIEELRAAK